MSIKSKLTGQNATKPLTLREQRKAEATELARLLYDIYKHNKGSGKIKLGQNNAKKSSTE